MNVLNYYVNKQLYGNVGQRCSFQSRLLNYTATHEDKIDQEIENEVCPMASPILSMVYNGNNLIASANEAGYVQIKDVFNFNTQLVSRFHSNAIFDIKWRPNQPYQLLTASGDLSIRLVDTLSPNDKLRHFPESHLGSVRTIDFQDTNVFASGGRDGHIKIWDLREKKRPFIDIPFAHEFTSKSHKRKRRNNHKTSPTNVVTAMLFNDYQLYTGGASDGVIKIWDTRKIRRLADKKHPWREPLAQIPYNGNTNYSDKQGYTCFVMSKGLLYASCSDNIVYCYSSQVNKMIGRYKGSRINNYTGLSIFQDEFLVSGSVDNCACIWQLSDKPDVERKSMILPTCVLPECDEVSSVAVVNSTGVIFTGTEEGNLRRWSFEYFKPVTEPTPSFHEQATIFKDHQEALSRLASLNESEIENIPNNHSFQQTTPELNRSSSIDLSNLQTPQTPRSTSRVKSTGGQRKRKSPRSYSPKVKKSAKKRHQPTEPLTPITNYYSKLPKKDDKK